MVKIGKRISIMLICALLIFGSAKRAEAVAEAGALSILGGSVAAGGIGATIAAIAPPVAVIVGLALAAQGIYVALSEASEEAGMTKTEYISVKLSEWALQTGRQYEDVCKDILTDTYVSTEGNMVLSRLAAQTISQFFNTLDEEEIVAPTPYGETYTNFVGVECPVVLSNQMYTIGRLSDGRTYSIINRCDGPIVLAARMNSTMISAFGKVAGNPIEYVYDGVSSGVGYSPASVQNGLLTFDIGSTLEGYLEFNLPVVMLKEGAFKDNVKALNGNFEILSKPLSDYQDGIYGDNGITADPFDITDAQTVVINPGMDLTSLQDAYGKSGTITIDNYLQSLQRALDGVQANTIAISNTLTGVMENVAVGTYNPVGQAEVSKEDTAAIPEVLTPVIDVTLNPTGSAAENSLKGLSFDLTEIFPFCIPFDIFALIEKFDVQPETPRILISLPLPGVDTTLDLDIDLSPFETVAVILRSMELIAFIVGLAMVTRNLIRG